MNGIVKQAFRNFKFVFFAQIVVLIFGFVKALIIPRILNISNFGYWQIYLFYSSYAGVFMLGFNDGIYLRYGKFQYFELPFIRLRSAMKVFFGLLLIFTVGTIFAFSFTYDPLKKFPLMIAAANILVLGLNGVFIYIFQITNQMKKYSMYAVLDKVLFMTTLVILAIINKVSLEAVIISDFISKCIAVTAMMFQCKEVWLGESSPIKFGVYEYKNNVSVGIKLMLAQLMGMLITGIGRVIVEISGNIEEYAYYSLGITMTNLVLVMITSISMLIYPTLKRLPEENYPFYYEKINSILHRLLLSVPLIYIATHFLIIIILPQYSPVLAYLNILFGVIVLQTKMQLLNNNFYNALRKEGAMLRANFSTVIMFCVVATIAFITTNSIKSIAVSTFIVMLWRSYASEIFLRKEMKMKIDKDFILEIFSIILFVLVSSVFNIFVTSIIATTFLFVLFLLNGRRIFRAIRARFHEVK